MSEVNINYGWIALVIVLVCFWGEPDLVDAIIFALTDYEGW